MSEIDRLLRASHSELTFEFVRSSGPGGQNVNKVATAAQLRFAMDSSPALPTEVKLRLKHIAGRRVSADGVLMIEARRYRTQDQNRADALERFDNLLRKALEKPKPRLRTKATKASREKRLQVKKQRGEIKKTRQSRIFE